MEEILTERFQYATIKSFKDYCRISDRTKHIDSMNGDLEIVDPWEYDLSSNHINRMYATYKGTLVSLPPKRSKARTKFFYSNDNSEVQERFYLEYSSPKNSGTFETTKDRQIKRHFGARFSSVSITTIERSIRRHGDKITFKTYQSTKNRTFNCIYFKKSFNVNSVTVNLKTGNFITLSISKNGKKKTQVFRTNHFDSIIRIINSYNLFKMSSTLSRDSKLHDEFKKSFNNEIFTKTLKEVFNIESDVKDYGNDTMDFYNDFMGIFINLKNIKVPDEGYDYLLNHLYPTEKFFKKNNRKLIASVLDMLGIKSKLTIKILHEHPQIDIFSFQRFIKYFGDDYPKYVGNILPEILNLSYRKDSNPTSHNGWTSKSQILLNPSFVSDLTDVEKENLIKITNSSSNSGRIKGITYNLIQLIDDHINMIRRLREYDPDLIINAKSIDEFHTEHAELSKMVASIKKGWVIEYEYDKKTTEEIEKPLDCLYDHDTLQVLYPKILKREEEYIEEGKFMHHCVASYAEKDTSIIVSLRNKTGSERVTCEFKIENGNCVQERYFCNRNPPPEFEDGLLLLREKMAQQARWGTLNWKDKKKVPIKINGVPIMESLPTVRVTDIFQDAELPFQY